jgi:hypothetical protein
MEKLQRALTTSDRENVHTAAAIRQGDPGAEILGFARSLPADLVVMGAAGAQRPMRPMGSVTAAVVARCDCPVLIVPAAQCIGRLTSGVFKNILCAVGLAPSSVGVVRQALSLAWETPLIGPPRQWTSTTQAVLAKSLCPVLITHEARPLPNPPGSPLSPLPTDHGGVA